MVNMFQSIRILFWCLHAIGLLSVEHGIVRGVSRFRPSDHARRKFGILFPLTLVVCGYILYDNIYNYEISDETGSKILWMYVYVVYELTLIGIFLVLTWQTHWKRKSLATLLNILVENEQELYTFTGRRTSYRNVKILTTIVLVNGVLSYVAFHLCYISAYHETNRFFEVQFITCCFLYCNLAMECLLGFCSCLLLIQQNQMGRLMELTKDAATYGYGPRALQFESSTCHDLWKLYFRLYNRFVYDVVVNLNSYFGLLVPGFCAYVCFASAAAMLQFGGSAHMTIWQIVTAFLWSLGDLKKLVILSMLSARSNKMVSK
uniref:Gustatory receptor n=1 Tax=Anopheles darlingi TaxID=43151 RepID=A0A2M4CKF5_ANODA